MIEGPNQTRLWLRMCAGLTYEEVGEKIGVGKVRAGQIDYRALRILRHPSVSKNLKEYKEDFYT